MFSILNNRYSKLNETHYLFLFFAFDRNNKFRYKFCFKLNDNYIKLAKSKVFVQVQVVFNTFSTQANVYITFKHIQGNTLYLKSKYKNI